MGLENIDKVETLLYLIEISTQNIGWNKNDLTPGRN